LRIQTADGVFILNAKPPIAGSGGIKTERVFESTKLRGSLVNAVPLVRSP
jgi:hypothetical protein